MKPQSLVSPTGRLRALYFKDIIMLEPKIFTNRPIERGDNVTLWYWYACPGCYMPVSRGTVLDIDGDHVTINEDSNSMLPFKTIAEIEYSVTG